MKPIHLILSLILCSCASTARADAIPQIVKNTPVTISETATPTPDYTVLLSEKERQLQDALSAKLLAQADAQNHIATAQAAQVFLVQATQTAEALRATENADAVRAGQTAQALEMTRTIGVARVTEMARDQMTKLYSAQADWTDAQTRAKQATTQNVLFGLFIAVVAVFAGAMLWLAKKAEYTPGPSIDDENAERVDQISDGSGVWLHKTEITQAEKAILRRAYVEMAGGSMSFRKMTSMDKETPTYFMRAEWENHIRPELLRKSAGGLSYCIERQDGALDWTEQGKRWLFESPVPLRSSAPPSTAENAAKTQHSTAFPE